MILQCLSLIALAYGGVCPDWECRRWELVPKTTYVIMDGTTIPVTTIEKVCVEYWETSRCHGE